MSKNRLPVHMRISGSPFAINWRDLKAVIAYAKRLGPGQSVIKHPDRSNYNITHTDREPKEAEVLFRT